MDKPEQICVRNTSYIWTSLNKYAYAIHHIYGQALANMRT